MTSSSEAIHRHDDQETTLRILAAAILLLPILLSGPSASAADPVGVRVLSVAAPERAAPLAVTLWYPAEPGGTRVEIGTNGVFQGVVGQQDAPIAKGTFPIILVSHGGMRSAANLAGWLDKGLADEGFVVADVHASRLGPDDADKAPAEIWKRPADLSAVLTAVENHPEFAGRLDPARVGAVGFFLGGTAVLSLAGGQLDAAKYAGTCDKAGGGADCAWFAHAGIDLHDVDATRIGRSNRDPRVKVAIAVDPELGDAFTRGSLSALTIPVAVVSLGRDVPDSGLAVPTIGHETVAEANAYSAFSLCKPKGAAILAESGAEPEICRSDGKIGRVRIHAELVARIVALLKPRLAADP